MTLLDLATERRPPVPQRSRPHTTRVFVALCVVAAVAARLPFLARPGLPDEAGFLQVAAQWGTSGGGSLYGAYWVDRHPLLISLFQIAADTGGLVALRVLGCVAVVVVVLLTARAADRLAGAVAARWTAVVAAALTASQLLAAQEVNGELLAAPFVALGLLAIIEATQSPTRRGADVASALVGAAAVAALLVKQNMFDVGVFALAYLSARLLAHTLAPRAVLRLGVLALAGAAVTAGAVAFWTLAHSTSVVGVLDAMYHFRIQAAHVVASTGFPPAVRRASAIAIAGLLSGLALISVLLVRAAATSRLREPAMLALTATLAFDVVSIALGGGYWLHYLVQMIVPVSIGAGLLVARGGHLPRFAVAATVAATVVVTGGQALFPMPAAGPDVGAAVREVALPGDTLTTLYGDAEVNLAAGLPSPYPYLWSLPVKVLDPDLRQLISVLSGPQAPTWLVVSHHVASWGLDSSAAEALIASDYRPVVVVDGQTIYLHDGVQRPTPIDVVSDENS